MSLIEDVVNATARAHSFDEKVREKDRVLLHDLVDTTEQIVLKLNLSSKLKTLKFVLQGGRVNYIVVLVLTPARDMPSSSVQQIQQTLRHINLLAAARIILGASRVTYLDDLHAFESEFVVSSSGVLLSKVSTPTASPSKSSTRGPTKSIAKHPTTRKAPASPKSTTRCEETSEEEAVNEESEGDVVESASASSTVTSGRRWWNPTTWLWKIPSPLTKQEEETVRALEFNPKLISFG